ncbi:hypothetical protein ATANTOWER_024858 [Ataeniobius toweri]|uniref:Uncharacterized protein n=1 Tax=Ataeniobius toweri TaxID=208326 RepID=A0ABU7BXV9_9TELE|nr:hypothetical protein [Ataeniobius toweri]
MKTQVHVPLTLGRWGENGDNFRSNGLLVYCDPNAAGLSCSLKLRNSSSTLSEILRVPVKPYLFTKRWEIICRSRLHVRCSSPSATAKSVTQQNEIGFTTFTQ